MGHHHTINQSCFQSINEGHRLAAMVPDVHLLPVDVVPVELEQVDCAGHPLVAVLLPLQNVPVVCTYKDDIKLVFWSQRVNTLLCFM